MARKYLSRELVGMSAYRVGGYYLGVIEGTVIDTETGEIRFLLIKMQSPGDAGKVDSRGRTAYPFDSLRVDGRAVTVI
ncbi:MAG: PRC-barrel domain containing protein [Thermoplasmatales archaeon]|nr:PRC-barrel domain containing protein [Thermoplasmatales archaeon]